MRRPLKVELAGQPLVLFRTGSRVHALEDRCPHRNAPLSAGRVDQGLLVCPYHGWRFDGQGVCRQIPGLCGGSSERFQVPKFDAMELDGIIWVSQEPAALPYRPPWAGHPDYDSFVVSVELPGNFLNAVENFLDATHTHFVHTGLIRGGGQKRSLVEVTVEAAGDRVEATYTNERHATGWVSRLFEPERTSSHGRFILPGVAEVEYRSARRTELGMTAYIARPGRLDRQSAQVVVATPRNFLPLALKRQILTPFFRAAVAQDQKILELQRANLARFGEERFQSTAVDLLRSHIQRLVEGGPLERSSRRTLQIEL